MPEDTNTHLALFKDVDPATEAIEKLHDMGIPEKDISIISGIPYSEKVLGRPLLSTNVMKFGMAGFVLGFIGAIVLNAGAVWQFPISVGGMADLAIPPLLIIIFELSMLGLMVFTFLGVLWESAFPSYGHKIYHPEISNGRVAVVYECPPEIQSQVQDALTDLGAEWVQRTEATKL